MHMEPLARDRFGDLYVFGWRHLGAALREHPWFYVPLALIAGASVTVNQPVAQFVAGNIDALAIFPALAFATRLARPSFKMGTREVLGLAGMWAILNGSFLVFSQVESALVRISEAFLFLALLAVPMIWIAVKLALSQAILLLQSPNATVMDAFADSWDYVEMEIWWRVVGLQVVILLPLILVSFFLRQWPTTFAVALAISAISIAATVWIQISLVAMASHTGVAEEHTDASAV